MSRAATPQEIAILRSDGLAARLFAIIDQPVTVYQCQVNQTFPTHDRIAQAAYDNASGNLSNVLPGMTVLAGTSPGTWDRGQARVRKAWTTSIAYIGETSEIRWEDNLYLTVIDEFAIWPRHLRIVGNTPYIDYDIAYSDQHANFAPVVCMGPDRVLKLTGSSVSTQLDASKSWVLGSTITGYSWQIVSGNASLSNANTATPTLTANTPGRILVRCQITAENGKTSTGYRTVHVYNDTNPPIEVRLSSFRGSTERGGFEFSIQLPLAPNFSIRDNSKVILFAEEYPQSIGPIAGAENVFAIGWIDESECSIDDKNGLAILSIKGTNHLLSKITGFPVGVENVNGVPTRWTEIQNLTVDKFLFHLLYYRSTLNNAVDFFLSGDTRQAKALQDVSRDLWQQIKTTAESSILASPRCDPFGRLFVQIDANYLEEESRANIPVIMTLTKDDYSRLEIQYRETQEAALVELSGAAGDKPIMSSAPGKVFGRTGKVLVKDRLLLRDQTSANKLAGLIYNRENRKFDLSIEFVSANRLITLVPNQYLEISISSNDNPRKLAYTGRIIPREAALEHNPESGALYMNITAEPEVFSSISTTILPPQTAVVNIPAQPELDDSWVIEPAGTVMPLMWAISPQADAPGLPCRSGTDTSANGPYNQWISGVLEIQNTALRSYSLFYARPGSSPNPTRYTINAQFLSRDYDSIEWQETTVDDWYSVYLLDRQGNRIAAGIHDPVIDSRQRTGYFNLPAGADCWGVEIALNSSTVQPINPTTVTLEYLEHPWSSHNNAEFAWGTYARGGVWLRAAGRWNTAFWSYTGYKIKLDKPGGYNNWWVYIYGRISTRIGIIEEDWPPNDPREASLNFHGGSEPDIARVYGPKEGTILEGYAVLQNTVRTPLEERDMLIVYGTTWTGTLTKPAYNVDIQVDWQLWPLTTKKILIDSVYLWNVCRHINLLGS